MFQRTRPPSTVPHYSFVHGEQGILCLKEFKCYGEAMFSLRIYIAEHYSLTSFYFEPIPIFANRCGAGYSDNIFSLSPAIPQEQVSTGPTVVHRRPFSLRNLMPGCSCLEIQIQIKFKALYNNSKNHIFCKIFRDNLWQYWIFPDPSEFVH